MSNGHRSIRLTVQFSEVFNEDFSLKLFNQFFNFFQFYQAGFLWIPLLPICLHQSYSLSTRSVWFLLHPTFTLNCSEYPLFNSLRSLNSLNSRLKFSVITNNFKLLTYQFKTEILNQNDLHDFVQIKTYNSLNPSESQRHKSDF